MKFLVALGVIGGAGWFGFREYERRREADAAPGPAISPAPANPVELPPVPDLPMPEEPEPPVPPAPPVAPPVTPPPPVDNPVAPSVAPLAPLPVLIHPDAPAALSGATLARLKDGRWAEHIAVVKNATLLTLKERARSAGPAQLDRICERRTLPLAMAQIALFNLLGEKNFSAFARDGFAGRTLTSPDALETFLNSLAPEDRPADALRVWRELDEKEDSAADKAAYRNLAIALALVHDRAGGEDPASAAYDYYRKAASAGKLHVDFEKLKPDELVWGVAADKGVNGNRLGFGEREWALKNLAYGPVALGKAYGSIPYRLNHAPYPTYSMENIRKLGGICWNQAQFSECNARARGVPSAYVSGEGSRGGHAWFAFRSPRGWSLDTGRYPDGYACGHAYNPQTGKGVREWDLLLFNDKGRSNGDLEAAWRLRRAASLLGGTGDREAMLDLLESAVRRNAGNPAVWGEWVGSMLEDKKERPLEFWQKLVAEYRIRMKDCPDFFALSDRVESERIFPKMDAEKVGDLLRIRRRQSIRENPARFDLLTDSVRREAGFYISRKDHDRVGRLYAGALREFGRNLPTFIRLADDFAELSKEDAIVRRHGLNVLESVFNKDVDTKLKGDAFALGMQARVAGKLSEIFATDGEERKSARYAARATEIGAKAKLERDAMR